ncbi:MAG: flagellar biosynthetic protein FliR [Clostridiaceae bacterium]|nr:flagellar biosynthetic protein FliR [Clostridiaceae bacterium]
MFLLSPIFGRSGVPARLKAGLAMAMAFLLSAVFPPPPGYAAGPIPAYALDAILELSVGLLMGYVTLVFFSTTQIAGHVIDISMGMGVGSIFDPNTRTMTPLSGALLNYAMLLYFFVNNGHIKLLTLLYASLRAVPIGEVRLSGGLALMAVEQFTLAFGLAASLMLPLVGAALLTETAMGILMRAVPQLNAYMVGIPMKVGIGLVLLYMMQPLYGGFCDQVFTHLFSATEQMILSVGGVG